MQIRERTLVIILRKKWHWENDGAQWGKQSAFWPSAQRRHLWYHVLTLPLQSVTLAWVSPASLMTTHETFDKEVCSKDVNSWSLSDAQTPHTQEPSKS